MRTPYISLLCAALLASAASAQDKTAKETDSARASGTIVKSKSNITNNREAGSTDSNSSSNERGTVVKSKSNITNNREASTDSSSTKDQSKKK